MSAALYHVELIDGREIEKPLPKKLHYLVQSYLVWRLTNLFRQTAPPRYVAGPELNVLTGDRTAEGRREYIVPDVVVTGREAKYEDGDLAEPPILAVEILSPGQTIADPLVRADRLLKLGCPMVWVIWPEKRKAWEYSAANLNEPTGELTAECHQLRVTVSLEEMWASLD